MKWRPMAPMLAVCALLTSCQSEKRTPAAVQFAGHRYLVVDEKVTWQEARQRCEKMGGYLCCIESQAEQEFIAKLAAGRYLYLGGTDEATEGEWEWINGSLFGYTCWMAGQPNNWEGNENYLATYDEGEWVDVAAEGDGFWMPTGFICEWGDEGK